MKLQNEWLYWGKQNLIPKYPSHKINDKDFKLAPSKSMIIGFESNISEPPKMVVIMEPFSKQIYIYSYRENKAFITRILKDKRINKVFFSLPYAETFLYGSVTNGRDLQNDIEEYYDDYCPNLASFVSKLYKQNFTFIKQQHRYIEDNLDDWTQNHVLTGVIQVIALYEMMVEMRENNKSKKRRLNK